VELLNTRGGERSGALFHGIPPEQLAAERAEGQEGGALVQGIPQPLSLVRQK
jgi:hypothetical protein